MKTLGELFVDASFTNPILSTNEIFPSFPTIIFELDNKFDSS